MVPYMRYKALYKRRERGSVVRVRVRTQVQMVVIRNFRRGLAVRLQEGSKCEMHLGNRMESDYLEHRAMGLHGGRGDETGKGGWRYHGVRHLSAKANEPGFNSEDHDK